ncbi:Anti-sigma regulatory factor (Ser/Thr protein kinase) [Streptomyces sp. 2224.1]|uniref:ATP-binding protein n=1 Tax=unclassified Streptomyces TaxID=2593676 RepID=UPI00088E25DE|nr:MULTISPECIES: ATP-binding protein [unclassified Streptomyces]PBC85442.1 anti-sigma regulatory factor (Ser/Thr protein kinase) [Streptomyces sp. 2321.6]SDR14938.1 Anti-sigma regulatory factor (Ser/Thr protein kinase) [Streptomyces sp. KS_16]SED68174.1 Anti-sigma regulatory factor (Ser/Thr protein kinase) [Streptomyces sp. 2133.1]SEE32523.1 Anti-sigma regulatory factor (Ser/Thr protein kinase) [Streptomyces sp. 2224.1]SNC71763.1 Anti-sigma regulatory factor (Ser/Thr protein kinase) [Streptomy
MTDGPSTPPARDFCCPQTAADARDFAGSFADLLHPPPTARTTQNLLLLVSELVTNALRHAGAVTALRLTADQDTIRICVEDASPARPTERSPDLTGRDGGFGWPVVCALAREVTIRPRPGGGKIVQAALAR